MEKLEETQGQRWYREHRQEKIAAYGKSLTKFRAVFSAGFTRGKSAELLGEEK